MKLHPLIVLLIGYGGIFFVFAKIYQGMGWDIDLLFFCNCIFYCLISTFTECGFGAYHILIRQVTEHYKEAKWKSQ
jgi:hypothetical protein